MILLCCIIFCLLHILFCSGRILLYFLITNQFSQNNTGFVMLEGHKSQLQQSSSSSSSIQLLSCVQLFGPRGLQPARLLSTWNSADKNTGVGCHSLLQGIFPTQGLNSGLQLYSQILYHCATWEAPTQVIIYLTRTTGGNIVSMTENRTGNQLFLDSTPNCTRN